MAVPKNKKSSSRTKMRRNRARLSKPTLTVESGARGKKRAGGELRRRHHIGSDGIYRGVQFFVPKTDLATEDEE